MMRVVFAIPGDVNTQSGGYSYDRRLIAELSAKGFEVNALSLGDSFPNPSRADLEDAAIKLRAVPVDEVLIVDGLAFGALATKDVQEIKAPMVALVHHPLAEEPGLADSLRRALYENERANLGFARAVIVTSEYTSALLQGRYGVSAEAITVAAPGQDVGHQVRNPQSPPLILSVGIQVYRKGHDVLLRALANIQDLEFQAVIAGANLDSDYANQLQDLRAELGLQSKVEIAGFVSDEQLQELYSKATIFALATRFEGYGMVFNEALSHGLPILSCQVGAVQKTLGDAGVLVAADDPVEFGRALRELLTDGEKLAAAAGLSRARASTIQSWSESFSKIAVLLDSLREASR